MKERRGRTATGVIGKIVFHGADSRAAHFHAINLPAGVVAIAGPLSFENVIFYFDAAVAVATVDRTTIADMVVADAHADSAAISADTITS